MEHRNTLEYSEPGQEFTSPGREINPPGQEFFGPEAPGVCQTGPGKRRRKRKALWLAAAFLVVAGMTFLQEPAVEPPAVTLPAETLPAETLPAETVPTEVPTQAPTEPPETLPDPVVYPLGNGILEITVYNGSFDMENGAERILYQGSIPEAEFTGLALPEPELQEGFSFLGFVLSGGRDSEGMDHFYRLQDVLTPEDTALAVPGEDGVRQVKIYAAWQAVGDEEKWLPLTLDGNGSGSTVSVDANGPLWSGGSVYLCAYPEPERDGYRFAGWYWDSECVQGPVESLSAVQFFEKNQEGEIDWSAAREITLYARWIPE